MALRSIGNIIYNKRTTRASATKTAAAAKSEETTKTSTTKKETSNSSEKSNRVLTLNLHGSSDSSDSEEINEIEKLFESSKVRKLTTNSSGSSSGSSISPKPTRATKRVIDDDDDDDENNKENLIPQSTTPQPQNHEVVIAYCRAPSGSSIRISKRVKILQAKLPDKTATNKENENNDQAVKTPAKSLENYDTFLENSLDENWNKKDEPKPKSVESSEAKNFDYFLEQKAEKKAEKKKEEESITDTRPKRRSAQKAISKVMLIKNHEDLNLEDIDVGEEDKSIQRKYKNRKWHDDRKLELFESEEQEDDAEYKPKKKSKGRKPKRSVIKTPTKSASKTKLKQHHALNYDDEETEKQLQEAAREYNEIKNYKLIVEKTHHD